jgi:hypothetical protein
MKVPPRVLAWRELHKNSLVGFATVQFGSGLIVAEIPIFIAGSRAWASPPARPWVDSDGALVLDEKTGRPRYLPVLRFANHGVRSSWSKQVLAALKAAHPEIFPNPTMTSQET